MLSTYLHLLLGLGSGSLVGFSLGLVGGGGSILAVPLLVYLVGVPSPHIAIGTSAVAVAVNAAASLANHARLGGVKWRCASVFALAGIGGAFAGSSLGKIVDGNSLLALFALLMLAVGVVMLRGRGKAGFADVQLSRENVWSLIFSGLTTGALSGFFGIGGGFLIVPALMFATGMPIRNAIGSSLVAVTAFGLTTSLNYAIAGYVDWMLAGVFVAGGLIGTLAGAQMTTRLAAQKDRLTNIFAILIFAVATYTLVRSLSLL